MKICCLALYVPVVFACSFYAPCRAEGTSGTTEGDTAVSSSVHASGEGALAGGPGGTALEPGSRETVWTAGKGSPGDAAQSGAGQPDLSVSRPARQQGSFQQPDPTGFSMKQAEARQAEARRAVDAARAFAASLPASSRKTRTTRISVEKLPKLQGWGLSGLPTINMRIRQPGDCSYIPDDYSNGPVLRRYESEPYGRIPTFVPGVGAADPKRQNSEKNNAKH